MRRRRREAKRREEVWVELQLTHGRSLFSPRP